MRSDFEFELLSQPALGRGQRLALAVSLIAVLVSGAWAAASWFDMRAARVNAAKVAAMRTFAAHPRTEGPAPHYAADAARVASLLQTPVDEWLRELERCQPVGARTQHLTVDAPQRRVQTSVLALDDVDLQAWLRCLNNGSEPPVWRVAKVSVDDGDKGVAAPTGTATNRHTTVQLLREQAVQDSVQR